MTKQPPHKNILEELGGQVTKLLQPFEQIREKRLGPTSQQHGSNYTHSKKPKRHQVYRPEPPQLSPNDSTESDVTIYGATGAVGKHVVDYLIQCAYYNPAQLEHLPLRISLSGRDPAKLQQLRERVEKFYAIALVPKQGSNTKVRVGQEGASFVDKTVDYGSAAGDNTEPTNKPKKRRGKVQLDIFVCDATNVDRLQTLAQRTRVVINLAGPMAHCATDLVGACATAGTHYVDITGEIPWASQMRRKYGAAAAASGARVVHGCGFSSVLSDLSVLLAVQELKDAAGPRTQIQHATCWFALAGGGPLPSVGALQTLQSLSLHHILPLRLFSNWLTSQPSYFLFDPLALIHQSLRDNINVRDTLTRQYETNASSHEDVIRHQYDLRNWRHHLARAEWNNQWPQSHECLHGAYSAPMPTAAINAKVIHASALSLNYAASGTQKKCNNNRHNVLDFSYSERWLPLGFMSTLRFRFLSLWAVVVIYYGGFLLAVVLLKLPVMGGLLIKSLESIRQAYSLKQEYADCEGARVEVYAQVEAAPNDSKFDKANCCLKFFGDAGNWSTAQCVSEAAFCLLFCAHPEEQEYSRLHHPCRNKHNRLPPRTEDGFGTPAQVLGIQLLNRLVTSPMRPVECTIAARNSSRMGDATALQRIYTNPSRKNAIAHIPSFVTE